MKAVIEKHKYLLSALFFIILIYITGSVIFKRQSLSDMVNTVKAVNVYYLLLAVCMMGIFIFCEAFNMYLLFRGINQNVPFFRCIQYVFVEFYFSAITPSSTGGQPMQIYYMSKDKISVSISSLVILIYLVVYQSVFLIYCGILYIAKYSVLHQMLAPVRILLCYGVLASALLIVSVITVILSETTALNVVNFLVAALEKVHLIKNKETVLLKVQAQIKEYIQGAQYLKTHLLLYFKACAVAFMQFTAYFSVPYFVYRSFGLTAHGYFDVIAAQSMVQLSAASLPLPGAVGASENSFYQIFQWIYPQKTVMSAMLLSRGINFYGFMIFSGIITLLVHIRSVRNRAKSIKK